MHPFLEKQLASVTAAVVEMLASSPENEVVS